MNEVKKVIIIVSISLLIVCGIGYTAYNLVMGRDGIFTKINNVEKQYDKTETLDFLTEKVKKIYMAVYHDSAENKKNFDEEYNDGVAIQWLVEDHAIEYYFYSEHDETKDTYMYYTDAEVPEGAQKRDDIFWVNIDVIPEVSKYGMGPKFNGFEINKVDVFLLEKYYDGDNSYYKLNYYDENGKMKEVGDIELKTPLIK